MALVPGNPGGSPGGQFYPPPLFSEGTWSRFLLEYGAPLLIGGPIVGRAARPVGGWLLRQLVIKPLQQGIPRAGGLGLIQQYQLLDDIRDTANLLKLGKIVSSGGGGPGESLTSTDSPPALHQQGQPVPVVVPAASISAHGGRRSGSKPRKRCPPGHYSVWSHRKSRYICLPYGTKDEYRRI